MRRSPLYLLLVVAAVVAAIGAPAAALDINGFMPEAGHGDLAFSYTAEGYDEFWVGETKVSDPGVGDVDIDSLSIWFDWGFTPDLALVVNAAYVDASSDGLGGFEDSGPQDIAALLKYRFVNSGPHRLLGAAGFRTALSDYEANLPVDLGDNTDDLLLRLVYMAQGPQFYFSQQVGYDMRGGEAPDGMPLFTELGYTAGRVTASVLYSQVTADGGTDIGDPGFTFPSNKDEYQRLGLKLYGRVSDRFGVSGVYFQTLDGRNSGDTSGFSLGANVAF